MLRSTPFAPALALLLAAPAALATAGTTTYALEPAALYMEGCLPPCKCMLVASESLTGSFELSFVNSTPDWFDHYAVANVDWTLVFKGQTMHVTGSGLYDIGGSVALQHRLRLDLSFDGGPLQSFDSGLVLPDSTIPNLDIDLALNGFVCFDHVFALEASPTTLGVPYCESNANTSGAPATLSAHGSATVALNDFTLLAESAPAGMMGLFFLGQGQQQTPFGEGFLCVGSSIQRVLPAVQVDASGTALRVLDLTQAPAAGHLLPGTTWSFQFWFRDPLGGPAGFNLSDAIEVDFR